MTVLRTICSWLFIGICLVGCTRTLDDCAGPLLDAPRLFQLRGLASGQGPGANLYLPSPLESGLKAILLPNLILPSRLENAFLKVRIKSIQDSLETLAKPNSNGNFSYGLETDEYSQVMAYFSVQSAMQYIEGLGFQLLKNRPLYVLVNAATEVDSSDPENANAFYLHHSLDPTKPRVIEMVGDTYYAPAKDRNMFWHEFGHFTNESLSRDVGFDAATEQFAIYTEGSALHECLADYLAQTLGNSPEIGRWVAKNFNSVPDGDPLRSALGNGEPSARFAEVARADGTGNTPERYGVGEWCTKVLWDIRKQWMKEDSKYGILFADRMIFSALSFLERDASMQQFYSALQKSDQTLHCGLHKRSIEAAFAEGGFPLDPDSLEAPISLSAQPIGVSGNQIVSLSEAEEVYFQMVLTNRNPTVARNVRIRLRSQDPALLIYTYQQGLGDLSPNQTLQIGTGNGLPLDYSVSAGIDSRGPISYQLEVLVENGPKSVFQGVIQ